MKADNLRVWQKQRRKIWKFEEDERERSAYRKAGVLRA